MSADPETRLQEAFTARAATTTVSDDAWARVNRRVDRHDHRRSVVLRSVAAAVIAILVVGGGVALLRDRGSDSGKVATSKAADSSAGVAPSESGERIQPIAPELRRDAAGSISARLGSTIAGPVSPGEIALSVDGESVFGIVPAQAVRIEVVAAPSPATGGARAPVVVDHDSHFGVGTFVFERGDAVAIRVFDAQGNLLDTKEIAR